MLIHEKIIAIIKDVEPIAKARKNPQQGYMFRGIDDVYLALQALFAKHGVFSVPEVLEDFSEERTSSKGSLIIWRRLKIKYAFYAVDGSVVFATTLGEGMDSGDKASNKAMSAAHKYALLQVFCIPTDEPKDSENESPEIAPKTKDRPEKEEIPFSPLYKATAHQKNTLAKIAKDLGITDVSMLKEISTACLETPMDFLEEKIKEYVKLPL